MGSTAMGTYTKASGDYSTALGLYPIASGYASTAMGRNTVASGSQSTAMGNNIEAANISELNNSGNVRGISFISTSDARYKKGIKDLTNGLDKVLQLQGVTYQYKDEFERFEAEKGKDQIGFIAQDVQKVLPELVSGEGTEENYLGIKYANLTVVLVEAIKGQQVMITGRGDKINELEEKLDLLSQKVDLLLNSESTSQSESLSGDAWIEQNAPNPFGSDTQIKYFIPNNSFKAQIRFSDISGRLIKVTDIVEKGHGELNLSGGTLIAGTYFYQLIVDDVHIDSKKMIISRL
ncbi:MAG: hypothetical protein ACI8VT_003853 [Saprospiraceae bacterium]|jgi:hypothetical protein